MSKKKMLEESQIRRMFQLAGMPAIGEGFIGGKYSKLAEEEEGEEEKEEHDQATLLCLLNHVDFYGKQHESGEGTSCHPSSHSADDYRQTYNKCRFQF